MITVNGVTYIKEYNKNDTCTGCVGNIDSYLCSKLSSDCEDGIYKEQENPLPENVYKGFNEDIVVKYLENTEIEFSVNQGKTWALVAQYEEPGDVIRLSHPSYWFRVKAEETVRYLYLNTNMGHSEEHPDSEYNAKVTFSNNNPTKVELL